MDCHFRELFAIEANLGLVQSVDKLAVAKAMLLAGGADPNDPQSTKLSLLNSAISVSESASSREGLLRGSEQITASTAEALRPLEKPLLRLPPGGTLSSSHFS